jgi:hypothetical protein
MCKEGACSIIYTALIIGSFIILQRLQNSVVIFVELLYRTHYWQFYNSTKITTEFCKFNILHYTFGNTVKGEQ